MVRIPTNVELREWAEERLVEVTGEAFVAADPAVFFGELESIIKAPLELRQRIRVAQHAANYHRKVRVALTAGELTEARRFVRGARREIADLQKLLDWYEQRLLTVAEGSRKMLMRQAGLECWALYQSVRQYHELLRGLERLEDAERYLGEALWKIAPPMRTADCKGALSILDNLLEGWGTATGSSRGRAWRSKILSDLILRLVEEFEDATGSLPKAGNRFMPFLERILSALPRGAYYKTADGTLATRVKRLLRSRPKTSPKARPLVL